jgi:hypothetical protein
MSDLKPTSSEIILHFDVPEHYIPLNQFIDTARSAQDIIESFNKEFFEGKAKYEIWVRTPEPGGLTEVLAVIFTCMTSVWAFLCTDIGRAYIKGLTDQDPTYWADQLGKKTRQLSEIDKQRLCAIIIAMMVTGFLQRDTPDLEKIGLSQEKFRKAYIARNKFYEACIENEEVRGLGFDRSHVFPITRAEFSDFIVDLPSPPEIQEIEEAICWKFDTADLLVNSPNWKRDSKRKWQGSTPEKQDIAFVIEDENFWEHVNLKDISPNITDNMQVQWIYQNNAAKPTNARVLRVLSYNGKEISAPLTDAELDAQVNNLSIGKTGEEKAQEENIDLFSYHLRR